MGRDRVRIAVVKNMIAPYTVPVLEQVAARADVDLFVIYEIATEGNRHWTAPTPGYPHHVLRSWSLDLHILKADGFMHVPIRGLQHLWRFRPDVVLASGAGVWTSPTNLLSMRRAARDDFAFVPWWGSFGRPDRTMLRAPIELCTRAFVSQGDAWLAYGSRAAGHLESLGADPSRIVISPNVARPPERGPDSGWDLGDSAGTRLLFSGQLIERKGIRVLLEAFADLTGGELWIAGDGPLRGLVMEAASRDRRIHVLGHLDWAALHERYARADALVLPSHYEVWGLVVNEAVEHGMPVVTTNQVAAADDLVVEGVTGRIVPADNRGALTSALRDVASWTSQQRQRCAVRSREIIDGWSIERAADGIVEAARLAIEAHCASSR